LKHRKIGAAGPIDSQDKKQDAERKIMLIQWLHADPVAHGGLILLSAAFIGYVLYMGLSKIAGNSTPSSSLTTVAPMMKRIWMPVILTSLAIFTDDAIERSGLKAYFWWDEFLAIMQSLPVIAWTWQLIVICRFYFSRLTDRHSKEANVVHTLVLINNIIITFLIIVGSYVILKIWSLDLGPLLTSAGLLTAVGAIAARDALSDFFGGITIFLDRPYHFGDYVVLSSGERGEVVNIGIRSTRIRTRDDVHISVPNSMMVSAKLVNESSHLPQYRIKCHLAVAYTSDLLEVETVLLDSLKDNPYILQEPEPRVRYRDFGDWAVELEVLVWIKEPRNRGLVRDQIIRGIHQAYRDGKIDIPYPQKDITIKNRKSEKIGHPHTSTKIC
jgi:MscS family membrane protein